MKQIKEEKVCTFTQSGCRLQLLKLFYEPDGLPGSTIICYQVRINRKIHLTTYLESIARKSFNSLVDIEVLQLNIE